MYGTPRESHGGRSEEEEGRVFERLWVQSSAMGGGRHSAIQSINLEADHLDAVTAGTSLDGIGGEKSEEMNQVALYRDKKVFRTDFLISTSPKTHILT